MVTRCLLTLLQAITTILSQLPGLTHLLLLPSQQPDAAAGAAAAVHAPGPGMSLAGRTRDWQLGEAALR